MGNPSTWAGLKVILCRKPSCFKYFNCSGILHEQTHSTERVFVQYEGTTAISIRCAMRPLPPTHAKRLLSKVCTWRSQGGVLFLCASYRLPLRGFPEACEGASLGIATAGDWLACLGKGVCRLICFVNKVAAWNRSVAENYSMKSPSSPPSTLLRWMTCWVIGGCTLPEEGTRLFYHRRWVDVATCMFKKVQ